MEATRLELRKGGEGEEMSRLQQIELVPKYQPIVDLANPEQIHGYEATIQGKTRYGSFLPPVTLFHMAKDAKETISLDMKARTAAVQNAVSLMENQDSLLFVNCHGLSFQRGHLFEDLSQLRLPLHKIVLELTEQTRIQNLDLVQDELDMLRSQGMKLALDDFGTGFSNFWLVGALQPDYIKLDRSIIKQIDQSPLARRVIEGLIAFSAKVQTTIISEGIERKEQADVLKELGVPYGQGFYLGYPFMLESDKIHF